MNHDLFPPATNSELDTTRMEAEIHPDLVKSYEAFRDHMQPKADVIYHPCSANDVSPSEVFPSSHVIYADLDENAMNALARAGYDARVTDVLTFDPGDVDILFLLNPAISPEVPSSYVIDGGFVVANDYHGTANWLHSRDEFEIKAIIKKGVGEVIFDDTNPEGYWQQVDSEEEFQQASGSMNTVSYARAKEIVEQITGRTDNILAEYTALIEEAQKKDLQERREMWEQTPDKETLALFGATPEELADLPEQPEPQIDLVGPWQIEDPTGRIVLLTPLPRKNGREEDIFIFQKRSSLAPEPRAR